MAKCKKNSRKQPVLTALQINTVMLCYAKVLLIRFTFVSFCLKLSSHSDLLTIWTV